jgi:hypothetical protein
MATFAFLSFEWRRLISIQNKHSGSHACSKRCGQSRKGTLPWDIRHTSMVSFSLSILAPDGPLERTFRGAWCTTVGDAGANKDDAHMAPVHIALSSKSYSPNATYSDNRLQKGSFRRQTSTLGATICDHLLYIKVNGLLPPAISNETSSRCVGWREWGLPPGEP